MLDKALNGNNDQPPTVAPQVKRARQARGMQQKTDTWKNGDGQLRFNGGRGQPEYDFLMDRDGFQFFSQQWKGPTL
ncbi:hypothetical protein CBOM_06365 [Ceraceosorus bombacis]|uniref:Uncharacterized protein n=1 Tax=Ceraceosorus bombacis TaxID=401625 RepID=A0A0N7LAF2_9BASI|nr:hypothetical protein CBOM_06365 [Ceraceosorus bombacis]